MQYPYYYDQQLQLNYYVGEHPGCTKCGSFIGRFIYVTFNTLTKGGAVEHYCMDCKQDLKLVFEQYAKYRNGSYLNRFILVPTIPSGAIAYNVNGMTEFSRVNGHDTFTAATHQFGTEKVVDRTRYAGRESFGGAQIGCAPSELLTVDEHAQLLAYEKEKVKQ